MSKRTLILAALLLLPIDAFAQNARTDTSATHKGSIDKAVIRRVIQQHIVEVKHCYEAQLEKDKNLAGKVMVRFVIGTDGKVPESGIESTTLKSPAAEKCIADAVRGWEFPKPSGGTVQVSYPFVLASAEPADSKGGK